MLHPGPSLGHVYSSEIKTSSLNPGGSVMKSAPWVNWAAQTLLVTRVSSLFSSYTFCSLY